MFRVESFDILQIEAQQESNSIGSTIIDQSSHTGESEDTISEEEIHVENGSGNLLLPPDKNSQKPCTPDDQPDS